MNTPVLVLHNPAELPDYFGDLINAFPSTLEGWSVKIVRPGLSLEQYLDRQELRKVAAVVFGHGAIEAVHVVTSQPNRFTHFILADPVLPSSEALDADSISVPVSLIGGTEELAQALGATRVGDSIDPEADPAGFAAAVAGVL